MSDRFWTLARYKTADWRSTSVYRTRAPNVTSRASPRAPERHLGWQLEVRVVIARCETDESFEPRAAISGSFRPGSCSERVFRSASAGECEASRGETRETSY